MAHNSGTIPDDNDDDDDDEL